MRRTGITATYRQNSLSASFSQAMISYKSIEIWQFDNILLIFGQMSSAHAQRPQFTSSGWNSDNAF